jgi:hypothetical protein
MDDFVSGGRADMVELCLRKAIEAAAAVETVSGCTVYRVQKVGPLYGDVGAIRLDITVKPPVVDAT